MDPDVPEERQPNGQVVVKMRTPPLARDEDMKMRTWKDSVSALVGYKNKDYSATNRSKDKITPMSHR